MSMYPPLRARLFTPDGDTELVDAGVLTLFTAFDVIDTLLARATGMEAAREDVMTFSEMPLPGCCDRRGPVPVRQ